jgi:hypothetical protein
MGAHQSNQNDNKAALVLDLDHIGDYFTGRREIDHSAVLTIIALVLALYLVFYIVRKCFRKMTGETAVWFAFHHKTKVNEEVRVVGNVEELGKWDPHRAPPMKCIMGQGDGPVWVTRVDLQFPKKNKPIEFKYVLMTREGNRKVFKEWEPCSNRVLHKSAKNGGNTISLHHEWGGRDKECNAPFWGGNAMTQPLMGG